MAHLSLRSLLCLLAANSFVQAAILVPRATTPPAASCTSTKTVTSVTTSTPVYTLSEYSFITLSTTSIFTATYFETVATETSTTFTVTEETTSTCLPDSCYCPTASICYPGCGTGGGRKRDVNGLNVASTTTVPNAKVCTTTIKSTKTAPTSTITTTVTYTDTPLYKASAFISETATPTKTVFLTSTVLGFVSETAAAGTYIAYNGQVFNDYLGITYFSDQELYVGSLATCNSCGYNENPEPCTYDNVTYNCNSFEDCQDICAQINGPHKKRKCLGAVYGGREGFSCWLNSHYPTYYDGRCGLFGIDPNSYAVGLLEGWTSKGK